MLKAAQLNLPVSSFLRKLQKAVCPILGERDKTEDTKAEVMGIGRSRVLTQESHQIHPGEL